MHNDSYTITSSDVADPAAREQLASRIRAFNDERSPYHRAIRQGGSQPLELYVRDRDGSLLGGLIGETYWGWLFVDKLYLDESLRRHGLGRELLRRAEQEAIRRGCRFAYLTTYSFQARGFYEQLGYYVVGQLTDYPPGATYFWMRKDLATDQGDNEQ